MTETTQKRIPWNKGLKGVQVAWNKGIKLPYKVWNEGKKCSYLIGNKNAKGNKPNSTSFKKGQVAHNKGVYLSEGFAAIHYWIKQELGQPNYCEHCGSTTEKQYDWANKDHQYKRDTIDWMRLCRGCHQKWDYKFNNRKTRKQ